MSTFTEQKRNTGQGKLAPVLRQMDSFTVRFLTDLSPTLERVLERLQTFVIGRGGQLSLCRPGSRVAQACQARV
jgi:hypothetical protein